MRTTSTSLEAVQTAKKNFGLSLADFEQVVEELRRGDDQFFQQVILVHFKDCTSYLERNLKASAVEAYDASIDALVIFCKKLRQGKIQYGNLRFLFTQMAIQALSRIRKKKENLVDLEEAAEPEVELDGPDADTLQVLDLAWDQLGDLCQQLLKGFYYDETPLSHLAELLGKSEVATRKQKQRCMQKLQGYFKTLYQR